MVARAVAAGRVAARPPRPWPAEQSRPAAARSTGPCRFSPEHRLNRRDRRPWSCCRRPLSCPCRRSRGGRVLDAFGVDAFDFVAGRGLAILGLRRFLRAVLDRLGVGAGIVLRRVIAFRALGERLPGCWRRGRGCAVNNSAKGAAAPWHPAPEGSGRWGSGAGRQDGIGFGRDAGHGGPHLRNGNSLCVGNPRAHPEKLSIHIRCLIGYRDRAVALTRQDLPGLGPAPGTAAAAGALHCAATVGPYSNGRNLDPGIQERGGSRGWNAQ